MRAPQSEKRFERLSTLAIELVTMPASNSDVERTFSALRRVQPWTRSRLSKKKIDMLQYLYCNHRFLSLFEGYF